MYEYTFNCTCPCHQATTIDYGWCMMCVQNHQPTFPQPQPEIHTNVDYSAMTFAVIQEIRSILTDIKKMLEEKDNGRRRTKSGNSNSGRRKS